MTTHDTRRWVEEPGWCWCDDPIDQIHLAEQVHGVNVYWCDMCWHRIVMEWKRMGRTLSGRPTRARKGTA